MQVLNFYTISNVIHIVLPLLPSPDLVLLLYILFCTAKFETHCYIEKIHRKENLLRNLENKKNLGIHAFLKFSYFDLIRSRISLQCNLRPWRTDADKNLQLRSLSMPRLQYRGAVLQYTGINLIQLNFNIYAVLSSGLYMQHLSSGSGSPAIAL